MGRVDKGGTGLLPVISSLHTLTYHDRLGEGRWGMGDGGWGMGRAAQSRVGDGLWCVDGWLAGWLDPYRKS